MQRSLMQRRVRESIVDDRLRRDIPRKKKGYRRRAADAIDVRGSERENGIDGEGERAREDGREGEREKDSPRETALDQSPLSVAPSSMRQSSRNVTSVAYVETRLSGDVGTKSSERSL